MTPLCRRMGCLSWNWFPRQKANSKKPRVSASVTLSDKTKHLPSEDMSHAEAKQKKTLSNNYIKCGKLFVGYSKINCITNYTTTGKYGKLINCSAWWRWMSAHVVPFNNLLATVFSKKYNSLKKSRVLCNWCVLIL